jgi:hypothetical protein
MRCRDDVNYLLQAWTWLHRRHAEFPPWVVLLLVPRQDLRIAKGELEPLRLGPKPQGKHEEIA